MKVGFEHNTLSLVSLRVFIWLDSPPFSSTSETFGN